MRSQSQPVTAQTSLANAGSEPSASYFTLVFEGDLRKLDFNPHTKRTPYGLPVTVGIGHAFDEFEEHCEIRADLLAVAVEFVKQAKAQGLNLGPLVADAEAAIARAGGLPPQLDRASSRDEP